MQKEIDLSLLEIRPLAFTDREALRSLSVGDADLDEHLRDDALRLQSHGVIRCSLAVYSGEPVGFVSIMTDVLTMETRERKRIALTSRDHPAIPALKIARLGVSVAFRQEYKGTGTALVRFAKAQALVISEHAGCRLVTVDAYPDSIAFYMKMGFRQSRALVYRDREHPSMWLDLHALEPVDPFIETASRTQKPPGA
ncbi:MAG: GNAT family N-acetyltransferase [Polyangiaceae bacterium]|nr:GNAT family N-acetyltransferase [Polyangiaceae bacterium]